MPDRDAPRQLRTLERLLKAPTGEPAAAMSYAADLVAEATGSDKVDVFLYEPERDSLAAMVSNQPLSALQRKLGLDVLQLSNGGRTAEVFKTGRTFVTGGLERDAEEIKGIRDGLGIRSVIGVPLMVGDTRRGALMLASLKPDYYTPEDVRFAEAVERWIGALLHRVELTAQIARNAAEESRRAVAEELVTVLAHDLRNHLSPLSLRLQLLRLRAEELQRSEDLSDLDAAGRALNRLTALVNDLLDVARLDRGVFQLQLQATSMPDLLREIAGVMRTPEQPIDVHVQAEGPLVVNADIARMRQCIENIIANAQQKSPRGAAVIVLARSERRETGDWCRVEIVDQGPGISQDMLPRLFERFATGRGEQGGLGLGLYLAQRIAVLHGGSLEAESEPGKGARFCLALPCLALRQGAVPGQPERASATR